MQTEWLSKHHPLFQSTPGGASLAGGTEWQELLQLHTWWVLVGKQATEWKLTRGVVSIIRRGSEITGLTDSRAVPMLVAHVARDTVCKRTSVRMLILERKCYNAQKHSSQTYSNVMLGMTY